MSERTKKMLLSTIASKKPSSSSSLSSKINKHGGQHSSQTQHSMTLRGHLKRKH